MALEYFQAKTVDSAIKALTDENGSRRFLIADEVGLGKTIVARGVAANLGASHDGPLNVVYFCPNLDIAAQNLAKFNRLDPTWTKPPDRLSLVATSTGAPADKFRIFSFTPDTSVPGWKTGQRTGRAAERSWIASLVAKVFPRLWRKLLAIDAERIRQLTSRGKKVSVFWPEWRPSPISKELRARFKRAFSKIMDFDESVLESNLLEWLKKWNDAAEFVLRARSALSLMALTAPSSRPDLLILDEFHRYADLILPDIPKGSGLELERRLVSNKIIQVLIGQGEYRPAVLLLSATPYRLMRANGGQLPGDRYAHFADLVEFLYDGAGSGVSKAALAKIADHQESLTERGERDTALRRAFKAKEDLEQFLRPVVARTERATSIKGDIFRRRKHPTQINSDDLEVFRHFATAVNSKVPALRSWVLPLWTSVPYPAEMIFGYAVERALGASLPAPRSDVAAKLAAHPQFRALVTDSDKSQAPIKPEVLALPWLPPTKPWWPLAGRWAPANDKPENYGKALIFSRYLATPQAVSGLLSAEMDRSNSRQKGKKTKKFSAQAYLRTVPDAPGPILSLFTPWQILSQVPVPLPRHAANSNTAMSEMRKSLRVWLKSKDVLIVRSKRAPRKPWRVAFELEWALGGKRSISTAISATAGLKKAVSVMQLAPNQEVTEREFDALADLLFSAPGAVVARSLQRHQPKALVDDKLFKAAFSFCWNRLRPYFGQRYFAGAILKAGGVRKGSASYPDALRRAVVDGGFEAVIDEHLAVMTIVGDKCPLDHLRESIVSRPGQVRIRRGPGRRPGHIRVHAALPFQGAKNRGGNQTEELRSESVRKAFNSPFWPHILTTTSVGQEGLDFHVWCDRVIHWDLPRDSVDFEQREGRVARYASLSVRRAIVGQLTGIPPHGPHESPFGSMFEHFRNLPATGLGLERWWSPPGHEPTSITFDTRFSIAGERLRRLQDDLMRYRLALGQPEPELFEQFVRHFELSRDEVRQLALNLSPSRHDELNEAAVAAE